MIRILLLAFVLFLTGTEAALAVPVIAPLLVPAFGAWATTVATALLYVATTAASYLLQMALAPKQKDPGVRQKIAIGDAVPQSYIVGRRGTAGSLVYTNTWGRADKTPNAYLVQVVCLSDLPVSGVNEVWINQAKANVNWNDTSTINGHNVGHPVVSFNAGGSEWLWIKFHDGSQASADSYLTSVFGNDPKRPWTNDFVGKGRAYAIITARYHPDIFGGQFPAAFFDLDGAKLYDPRLDSTNGGSGTHRYGQYNTHEFTENPWVIGYNIKRGIYYGGEWMHGGQNWSKTLFDNDSWFAAMNYCWEMVQRKNGTSERRYKIGAEIQVDEEPIDVLDRIMTSTGARFAECGGVYKLLCGPVGASVYSFSDGDVIISEDMTATLFPGYEDIINTVGGTYVEPANMFAEKAMKPKSSAAFIDQDGGQKREKSIQLGYVQSNSQAQRLARLMLKESRRFVSHRITLPPSAQLLEPNDVISWTSERFGYASKKFIVGDVERQPSGLVVVPIREAAPTDNDYDPLEEDDYIVGEFEAIVPVEQASIAVAASYSVKNNSGINRRPAIKLTWNVDPDDTDIAAIKYQVRDAVSQDIVARGRTDDWEDGETVVVDNAIQPNNDYETRVKIIPYSSRPTAWSAWTAVTAPDTKLSDDDVYLPVMRQEIDDDVDAKIAALDAGLSGDISGVVADLAAETAARISDVNSLANDLAGETAARVAGALEQASRYRGVLDEIQSVRDLAAEQDFANYQDKEELRQSLTVRIESSYAEFDQRITVAVADGAAVAQRVTTLEADTDALSADIVNADIARISGDTALAAQIQTLSAGTNSQFDHVAIWYFDDGTEGWSGNGAPTAAAGALRPADEASNPYVYSPGGLDVAASTYGQVRARVRNTGSPTWEGWLYWKVTGDPDWTSLQRIAIDEPSWDANDFGLLTVNAGWSGAIEQIRLDLSAAQTPTDYLTIDWVAIGRPAPGASSAELAAEQQARISGDSALASDIVALETSLTDTKGDVTGLSTSVSALESEVTAIDGIVTAHGIAIDALETEIVGKASASAVSLLETEVEAMGGAIGVAAQGAAVTALRNELLVVAGETADQAFADFLAAQNALKATADASQSLATRIDASESSIAVLSEAVTAVEAELPNMASASGLSALTARVEVTETSITAQATLLDTINVTLADKASATALSALDVRVTEVEGEITTQAEALTAISAAEDGTDLATANFRMNVEAGPLGYASRIGMETRAGGAGKWRGASLYLDVPADDTEPTRVAIVADQVIMTDGTSAQAPFTFQAGVLTLQAANIGTVTAGKLQGGNGKMIIDLDAGTIEIFS